MIYRVAILFLFCLSASAQYNATHYIDFEGGSNGSDVDAASMNASLHGPAMVASPGDGCSTVWCINAPGHSFIFDTAGSHPLIGTINVYGAGSYGPTGTLGVRTKLDTSTAFLKAYWGLSGSTSASTFLWVYTDVPQGTNYINIDFYDIKSVDGTFVNVILYGPQDGTLKFTAEISSGSAPGNTVAVSRNTLYGIDLGENIGGTNGNIIRIYDANLNIVGEMHNTGAPSANPNRVEIGCQNGANAGSAGSSIWMDSLIINTNGDFPLLPGQPCPVTFLMSSNSIPWKLGQNAGVPGGIPSRAVFTNLDTAALGANPSAVINQAISVCPSNKTVKINVNGTVACEAQINFYGHDGVTLDGLGMGQTILTAPALVGDAFISMGTDSGFSAGTSISSGWAKGASNLVVASTSGLAVGQLVECTEIMNTNVMWTSDRVADTNGSARMICHVGQIKAIVGSTVTIWPPLTFEQTPSYGGKMHHFGGFFQQMNCYVQNMTLDCSANNVGYGIRGNQCVGCGVTNVEVKMVTGYCVYFYKSALIELAKVFVNQQPSYGSSHGGILMGNGNGTNTVTGWAIYNSILNKIQPGVQINGGSSGGIAGYNLGYDNQADSGSAAMAASFDSNHGGENNCNLWEGNIGNVYDSDGNFSGVLQQTLYRNWFLGWIPTYTNQDSRPISMAKWDLYSCVVGNVLGCTNIATPDYFAPTNQLGYGSSVVYWLGFPNGIGNSTYTNTRAPSLDRVGALDLNVSNTATFYANWDSYYKSNNFFGRTDICATNLPDSLYLDSKPPWFSFIAYPPINSTNGYTNLWYTSIPAGWAFFHTNAAGTPSWPDESITAAAIVSGAITMRGAGTIQ